MTADVELQGPSDAITALSFHPSDPDRLLASSWDASIRLYNASSPSDVKTYTPSRAPVFDVTWGANDSSKVYSGGLDRSVIETDVETSTYRVIANHDDAVKCVKYLESANCLVSASWDSTLRLHDPRSSTPANSSSSVSAPLPSKAFSMDSAGDKLVLAMAQRHVLIYDHRNLSSALSSNSEQQSTTTIEPYQKRENSLKFMTRSVRCMPNGKGYASSSIEGRVAVEYFDQSSEVQKGHFAFKCHRATVDGVDTVYPVNALAFHPMCVFSSPLLRVGFG
ncbi:hypothetical protein BT93_L0718 [Corymbia citriodora subsp. variegata]|uniref:Mitotic checkpoint protein BUB3 n=1 Tax=Corymbia citriodora subsp. variegata TaxID=360336 RepID=A0A8T0CEG5_CORYI|nr:hypothetical protein BT93_L0718 [Corymbia citriodora subsp. variegata]